MRKLLLFPLLLGSSALVVVAPTQAAPATPGAAPAAKPAAEKINAGELRLDGKITALLGTGEWQLGAVSWTSPRGVTTRFDDIKSKVVEVAPDAFVHGLNSTAKIALKDIKLKSTIAVIGKNGPDGTVQVREVILLEDPSELKTVGTLSSNRISSQLIDQSRAARSAGQLDKALDLARKAAENAAAMGDASGEALASQDVGILYSELKQGNNALESFKHAQGLGERLNNALVQVLGLEGQGDVLASMGQVEQAGPLLERAVALSATTPTSLQISVLSNLAGVYTRAKKRNEAVGALVRLLPLEENAGKYDEGTGTLLSLARLQAPADAASAKTYLDQARDRMGNIRDESARLALTLSFATALKVTGDATGAAEQYEVAAKLAEARGDTEDAARIRAIAAKPATDAAAPDAATPDVPAGAETAPNGTAGNGNVPNGPDPNGTGPKGGAPKGAANPVV